MILKSISYSENDQSLQPWKLEKLSFGRRMLIVGRNASGKSRSLNLTSGLARLLIGAQPVGINGNYVATFEHENKEYKYEMKYENSIVIKEKITINGNVYLDRNEDGTGDIFAEQINNGMNIKFQIPQNVLASLARRDLLQHSFIEPLYLWANSLRYYRFGAIDQGSLAVFISGIQSSIDDKDQNAVVAIFKDGVKKFGDAFISSIINDLSEIDYNVENIELSSPLTIRFDPNGPQPVSLNVKEKDLNCLTDQLGMSTGMFRVLALLVHVNYAQFNGSASSVLIDDIGEGLDFDRSCRLIKHLREKSIKYGFQLVMTSNDKFVMNNVPLDEWTVLHRTGGTVHVRNNENSKEIFDDFKFTGLSNFSFFEMNAVQMNNDSSCEE